MTNSGTLTVTTPSDREVQAIRLFNAPRELFDEDWTGGETVVTTTRDAALQTNFAAGMEAGYDTLAEMLASVGGAQ